MGKSLCLIVLQKVVLKLLLVYVFVANVTCFALVQQPSCHNEERSALLQFKDSFVIEKSACDLKGAYPKFLNWNSSSDNCCLWDGIDCESETGHVIGVDLSSSCLFGSINSHSSLFNLVHLQMLDLSDNHFNFSQIPTAIGKLSGLTFLNLSASNFYGQVPLEISNLTKLTSLSICCNIHPDTGEELLHLKNPNFETLVQNLSRLETLILSYVNISSKVPDLLTNLTSLTTLYLRNCELYGEFPSKLFHLPNLQYLSLRFNKNLTGRFPEFQKRSPLKVLRIRGTNFFGSLPSSLDKLESLDMLDLVQCNFSGPIPSSIGELSKLTFLDIGKNNFNGNIPSALQKLSQLTYLDLGANNFSGTIPPGLQNLTQLTYLSLRNNQITGSIPPWIWNLTLLTGLALDHNHLTGSVSQSVSMLVNLDRFYVTGNNLGGSLKFDTFSSMKNLAHLRLGQNNFTSVIIGNANANATSHGWKYLDLNSCKLRSFPSFLMHENELRHLILSENNLSGEIPNWIWNMSKETLIQFDVSKNFLTSFNLPAILPWKKLRVFAISSNILKGPLPIPPPSGLVYDASINMLTGEISPLFCRMSSLRFLDLSDNKLHGEVPQCLANSSSYLVKFDISSNSFQGIIPQLCPSNTAQLKAIDVSRNQLQGKLPRSLSNCLMLETVVVSNNRLHDSFPSWLGSLPELKLLMLHQNQFYGTIEKPKPGEDFSSLQVLDLSSNNFTGDLPSQYINNWTAMKSNKPNGLSYLGVVWDDHIDGAIGYTYSANYEITIMTKGVKRYYGAILDIYAFIDLSDNKFEGEISRLFGNLKTLRSLNFSNNVLMGCIPSSLGNLTELESLDLSRNNLSCHIPQELKQLGFLSSFNVSHNNLIGPVPQGQQFDSFDATSFYGNPKLCGGPLPKKCGNPPPSPSPPPEEDHKDSESFLEENWMSVLAGCIGGLVVGVVLAEFATKTTYGGRWLVEMEFESRKRKRKMKRGRRT